ncbi:MAG: hypothetical protein ACFE96_11275 [Candidatus Hermodarchaeota archaeon]
MFETLRAIKWNKTATLPLVGAVLMVFALFTPFVVSRGVEDISIASQSDVWYWGFYNGNGQIGFLRMPFMLNVIMSILILFFAILTLVLSIEHGINNLNRKLFGELIGIFSLFIYLSMTLTIGFIQYGFSLLPDLEKTFFGLNADFWAYRKGSFGYYGVIAAMAIIIIGSIISLRKSRKSFFYIEITAFILWLFIMPIGMIY